MTDHDHDHDHDRTVKPMVDEITDFEVLEIALRELCIEKGIFFTAEEHRRFTEFAEQIGPTPAARLVARAWLDPPDFKALALAEPMTASKAVGVDWLEPTGFGTPPSDFTAFQILEDTPTVHHVIVCALCSCYPRPILGNSPEWYRTPQLPQATGPLAPPGARRVRPLSGRRRRGTGAGLQPEAPVHGDADAPPRGHRGLDRGSAHRDHHPRLPDRCRTTQARG